jgi:hypothetical protein
MWNQEEAFGECHGRSLLGVELAQSFRGQHERLVFFAEAEANLLRTERGIGIEARAGNAGNADFANQMACELDIVFKTEATDVSHDIVSAIWASRFESRFLKFRQN